MQSTAKNVLILDDDLILQKILGTALRKKGYNTFTAGTTSDGYDVLTSNHIDIVLSDIILPGDDGFCFCKKVRENPKHKTLPFIFISSKHAIEDKEYALSLGADDFITKPVNTDELYIKMEALFKRLEIYKIYGVREKIEDQVEDRKPLILLVDDDIFNKEILKFELKETGFDCLTADNALDGFELAKNKRPDIILSDLMMPDVDGFEFRRMTLKEPLLKDVAFIFLTSINEEEALIKGYDLDIKDYIIKTSNPKLICIRVKNIVMNLRKERRKALNELQEAASNISMEVIPANAPDFEGYQIKHWHVPYKGMPGGDFIDYIRIDANRMCIILGDIMGKQWGAWFFAFSFIGYIRSAVRISINSVNEITASEILKRVNETVYNDSKISEIFTTVSCLILNNKNNTVEYSGAGDLSILKYCAENSKVSVYNSEGMLLGLSQDGEYNNIEISVNKNDEIILFTDGIIESRNKEGIQFGMASVINTLEFTDVDTDRLNVLKDTFSGYTESNFEDDITLLTIKTL
ncbi:MAG: response regulator [Ignavibacteria bacterium]